MIEIDILRKLIVEYQEFIAKVDFRQRKFSFEDNGRYVLVGIRQAGKSYLLYQRARELVDCGHSIDEICYINFDDERLMGMDASSFDRILEAYRSLYACQPILFLDEIQNIYGWEKFARRLANQNYRVFITGSNAKMLSREIATTLGERYIAKVVQPYSFEEYLSACDVELERKWMYSAQKDIVRRLFDGYISFGGFPETLKYADKRDWLNGLFGRIFFNDMVVRNGVKNVGALKLTVKRVAENVMQPVSSTRIANLLKTVGYSTGAASVLDYLRYMRESCLLFSIPNYAGKFAEKEGIKKHYFADNGILNLFLTNPKCALLENMCAIEMYRRYGERLFYFSRNIEVDFYVPEEGLAVQVAYSISDEATERREVSALNKLNAVFSLKRMVIVTMDEERIISAGKSANIDVIPVWKWLLSSSI